MSGVRYQHEYLQKGKYLIHIVLSDSSLLLSDSDTLWRVSVTEALLPRPLGGILTPGAHPQISYVFSGCCVVHWTHHTDVSEMLPLRRVSGRFPGSSNRIY